MRFSEYLSEETIKKGDRVKILDDDNLFVGADGTVVISNPKIAIVKVDVNGAMQTIPIDKLKKL